MKLKEYRKIREDKLTTTLEHARHGYRVNIARESLTPKLKGELAAMPVFMADGGQVEDPTILPVEAAPVEAEQQGVSPEVVEKRNIYNQLMQSRHDIQPSMMSVMGPKFMFGQDGQAPEQFNPDVWQEAEATFVNQKAGEQEKKLQMADQLAKDNAARAQAGLPTVPSPTDLGGLTPQAQAPQMPQPPQAQLPQQPDPFAGVGQMPTMPMEQAYTQGLEKQQMGLQQEAQAASYQAQLEAQAALEQQARAVEMQRSYENHYSDLMHQQNAIVQDIQKGEIRPNHYMESMGAVGKVGTAIGLMLSGLGAGASGQENMAMRFLENQIQRDVDAQRLNLGRKQSILSANLQQFGNMRDAMDFTRATQMQIYATELKNAAAKATSQLAQAQAMKAAGQLELAAAPVMQQLAIRRMMISGAGIGAQMSPEMTIRFLAPEGEQQALFKDLKEAQDTVHMRDNIVSAFDQLAKLNTIANRVSSPIQTSKQVAGIRDPIIATMSKGLAGRFTEADAKFIGEVMPAVGDDNRTIAIKRARLNQLVSEKLNFPSLKPYGVDAANMGRYSKAGQTKFEVREPVKPKGQKGG